MGFSADESPNELLAPVVVEVESEEPDAGLLATKDEEGAIGNTSHTDDVTLRDQGSDSEPLGADR